MTRLWIFMKMIKSDYQRSCFLLPRGCIWRIFIPTDKKGRTKRFIYELKKLISLVYNINYYLIVPIDRAPQLLYSQSYCYRLRNMYYIAFHCDARSKNNFIRSYIACMPILLNVKCWCYYLLMMIYVDYSWFKT